MKTILGLLGLGVLVVALNISIYEFYTFEGFVAYCVSSSDSKPAPVPSPDKHVDGCTCGGTGKVKTGDGLHMTECPCGPNCSCKKQAVVENNRVLLFTDTKSCPPCRRLENKTFSVLRKASTPWKIGPEATNHIQVFDSNIATTHDAFEKWQVDAVPTMVLIDSKGNEVRRSTGFMTFQEFGKFFYGK